MGLKKFIYENVSLIQIGGLLIMSAGIYAILFLQNFIGVVGIGFGYFLFKV